MSGGRTASGFGLGGRLEGETGAAGARAALVLLSFLGVAVLVARYDAPLVLAALIGCVGAAALFLAPDAATMIAVFLLYVNFPAILTKRHGVPDVIAGAFILLLVIPLAHLLVVRRQRLRTDTTFALMLGFVVVLLLGCIKAVDKGVALDQVLRFVVEGLLIYWLVINVIRSLPALRRAIWTLLAAGSLLSALSIYQDATGSFDQEFGGLAYRNYVAATNDEDREVRTKRATWDRAQGPLDEPNRFAQTLIVLVPLAGFAYRTGRSSRVRLCAAAAGLLILGGIGVTLSRGTFIGLVLVAIAMVRLKWLRPVHLLACLVVAVISISIISPYFIPRMLSIVNAKHLTSDDPSARDQADGAIRGRLTSMLTAFSVFRDHPVLGVGPGQFRFYYMEYYRDNPDLKFRGNIQGPRRAHSLYLEMGAETGAIGLSVFVGMVLLLMWELSRVRRDSRSGHGERVDAATAFWLSLLAYLVTGMFLHLSYQRYFWFLLALAGAGLHAARSTRGATLNDRTETATRSGPALGSGAQDLARA